MIKRTTVAIDEELLARAKNALGSQNDARQRRYLETLSEHLDLEVLRSDDMWR